MGSVAQRGPFRSASAIIAERAWIAPPGLFRLLLAALVIVNHSVPVHFGPCAVYLFFTLSGYWVHRMWGKEYAAAERPYATFLVSRLWRLLPVYYVTLAVFLAGNRFFPDALEPHSIPSGWAGLHSLLSHLFLLGYATLPFTQKLVLPVWSLDIELQFYLVFPLLLPLFEAAGKWRPLRLLPYAVALAGVAGFFWRYATIDAQSGAWLPMYFLFFLVGVESARRDWRPSAGLAGGSLLAGIVLVALCVPLPVARPIFFGQNVGWLASYNPHGNFVLALALAPYALATVRRVSAKPDNRPRGGSGFSDRDLGNITYDLYLLHWPVISAMEHFTGKVHTVRQLPYLFGAWLLLLALAGCVYRFLDRPLDALRRRFVSGRRGSAGQASTAAS